MRCAIPHRSIRNAIASATPHRHARLQGQPVRNRIRPRRRCIGIGYRDAAEDEPADLCVVNTCTVTHEGDSKSRQAIRQLAARNPGARIVVMGCYATRAPEEVAALPGVAEVVTDKRELPDLLGRFGVIDMPTGISSFGQPPSGVCESAGRLPAAMQLLHHSARAAAPHQPPGRSTSSTKSGGWSTSGYREVVLTGIHLGHYGVDWNRDRPKHEWMRLGQSRRSKSPNCPATFASASPASKPPKSPAN